jgi:hypothetical protein
VLLHRHRPEHGSLVTTDTDVAVFLLVIGVLAGTVAAAAAIAYLRFPRWWR